MIKVTGLFGRYKSLLRDLIGELLSCVYLDFDSLPTLSNINAQSLYACMPYFVVAKREAEKAERTEV